MTACGTDYLTQTWLSRSYIIAYSIFVYFVPLFTIIYSYWFIVQVNFILMLEYVKVWVNFHEIHNEPYKFDLRP